MASYHPTDEKRENFARTLLREKKHLTKKSSCERDKNGPPNIQRTKKEKTEREKKIAKGHPEKAMYIVGTKHTNRDKHVLLFASHLNLPFIRCRKVCAFYSVLSFYFLCAANRSLSLFHRTQPTPNETTTTHTHPTNQAFFLSSSSFFLLFPCR